MKKIKKEVKFRHKLITFLARIIYGPIIRRKFNYKPKLNKIKKDGPYLILANHSVAFDPIILGTHFNFPIYYVATDQIFNLGFLSKLLVYAVNPIPKAKSTSDPTTIKRIKRVVNQGGSVCIFIEGNLSYDGANPIINKSIVKLIRFLKIKLLFFNMSGFYFQSPRWAAFRKKGKASCTIRKIVEASEYNDLTDEQLYEMVVENTKTNAYIENSELKYKYTGINKAEGLERFLLVCPKCFAKLSLKSSKDSISCNCCNSEFMYDDYGYLNYEDKSYSLVDLHTFQLKHLYNWFNEFSNDVYFSDDALLEINKDNHKINMKNIKIFLSKNNIEIQGEKYSNIIPHEESVVAIQGKHKIIIYTKTEKMLINFENYESPYKYYLGNIFYKYYYKNNSLININDFRL